MTANTLPKLQPLNFGELLDRAIRLYRKNFVPFTSMVAIIQTPLVVLQVIAAVVTLSSSPVFSTLTPGSVPTDPSQLLTPGYFIGQGITIIVGIIAFFASAIMYAVIIRGTSDSYLTNEQVTVAGTFRKASSSFGRLFLTLLLSLVIGILLFIWFIIPCFGWLSGPGLFVYGSWVMFPLIMAVGTLEGQGPASAYRRAWDLARRRFWWTLGLAFVIFLFGVAVTLGPSTLTSFALGLMMRADMFSSNPALATILNTIVQSIVNLGAVIITTPIQIISFTLMYFDLRVRTEGFDMTVAAADTGIVTDTSAADLVAQAPKPQSGNPITGKEVGYFFLLGIIIMGPIILLYGAAFAVIAATMQAFSGGF